MKHNLLNLRNLKYEFARLKFMPEKKKHSQSGFIPARESPLFISIFGRYTKWLFSYRFKRVWIKQNYFPGPDSKTIYYLNHSSWWDGIIPLILNQYVFRQKARAMMENRQMARYRLFRWIGAFSINLDKPRGSIRSLRYAVESMQRENSSLYIYPEGKIVPFTSEKPEFRGGLSWLCKQLPGVDVVPVGIYIHTIRHNKPELHISIGNAIETDRAKVSNESLQQVLEFALRDELLTLQEHGGFDNSIFTRWI